MTLNVHRRKFLQDPFIRVIGLVGEQGPGFKLRQEGIRAFKIVCLAQCQEKIERVSKRVNHSMNFGAQSAFCPSAGSGV